MICAEVAALDQMLVYNRFGSHNPFGMIFALTRDLVPADRIVGFEEKVADHFGGKITTGSAFFEHGRKTTAESSGIGGGSSTEYDPSRYVSTEAINTEGGSGDDSVTSGAGPSNLNGMFSGMDESQVRSYVSDLSRPERVTLLENLEGVSSAGSPEEHVEKLVYIGVNGIPDGGEAELRTHIGMAAEEPAEAESDDD